MDALLFKGETHKLILPSGRSVVFRENNGEDEEILTRIGNEGNKNIQIYLAGIIEEDSEPKPEGLTPLQHIKNMKVNDAYYLMFKQRLINLGDNLEWNHTCTTESCKQETGLEQDLKEFDTFTKYDKGSDAKIEHSLSSGKKIRFKILTLGLEEKLLDIPFADRSNATVLYTREIEIFYEGNWVRCTHLKMFSSKDMAEIRALIKKYDDKWDPILEFKCPKCQTPAIERLLGMADFFYPVAKL